MQKLFRSLIAVGGLAGLVACGDDVSVTEPPPPAFAISGAPVTAVQVGAKIQLSATEAATWASSAANVASVDGNGLVTAVVTDVKSGDVLMVAHMNREAWDETLASGNAVYFSRARRRLWRKGEASGKGEASQPVFTGPADPRQRMLLAMMRELRKSVEANAEYVGDRFADEARKIHYQEAEKRGIYGEASAEAAHALIDEGIEVHPLPRLPEDGN